MQTITHYEVFHAVGTQWALRARFTGREQQNALALARTIEEEDKRPVAVIEEIEELISAQFDIRMIHRTPLQGVTIKPPSSQNDIASRLFMVVLTGLALGAVVATVTGTALSSAMGTGGQFNVIVLGSFLIGALLGGSLIFRLYVPVGLIVWNSKDPESRKRTIMTLAHGAVVPSAFDSPTESLLGPGMTASDVSSIREDSIGNFQTKAVVAPPPPPPPPAIPQVAAESAEEPAPSAPVNVTEVAAVADDAFMAVLARIRTQIETFTDGAMSSVVNARPGVSESERQAINLYLSGAAQTASDRNALDEVSTTEMIRHAIVRTGMEAAQIDAFLDELENVAERPRFRRMIDNGAAAFAATLDEPSGENLPSLNELLNAWNDPANQMAGPQQVTFLLTDIVGSTALTSQIGNAGAQRVVRAHNAITRAAAKAFKGREIKHTGDGMLLLFPDPAGAARAAMDIQQEATNYAKDNPAAPLVLRVGVHQGDAVFEDGDYYGAAVSVVNGVTGAIGNTEIGCTAAIRKKVAGAAFRFEDLGIQTLKGSPTGIELYKLLWEPKRPTGKTVLEYRQIGTAPAAGGSS